MSDNQPTPDLITWKESGIIIKQVVMIIGVVGAMCGVAFTPEDTAKITAIVTGLFVIGVAAWTIHNRLKLPCPPVTQKNGETK